MAPESDDTLAQAFDLIDAYAAGRSEIATTFLAMMSHEEIQDMAALALGLLAGLYLSEPAVRQIIDDRRRDAS